MTEEITPSQAMDDALARQRPAFAEEIRKIFEKARPEGKVAINAFFDKGGPALIAAYKASEIGKARAEIVRRAWKEQPKWQKRRDLN